MRNRKEPSANYSSVYINGKTLRIPIDPSKPITELRFPEFLDVAINSKCLAYCPNCYTSATKHGKNFENVVSKINDIFGPMSLNERVYQVALGGAGEPTMHDDFVGVLKAFHKFEIVPNYTTNGMHLSEEIIDATKKYAGGVAVSAHPHIKTTWKKAVNLLLENKIRTNIHVIVSDAKSIDYLDEIYKDYSGKVEYIVILPHMNVGRGADDPQKIDYDRLEKFLDANYKNSNIALGANLYSFLKEKNKWGISLYSPEIFSKYLVLDDPPMLYNSSFDISKPVKREWLLPKRR
jgi:MoaA/NifB/PqqE/SkfB family radical SAM enzyme